MAVSSILLLFLLSIPLFPHLFTMADANFIEKTCKATKFYDLCVSSLESDPKSQNADVKGLATIMIGVGISNSTATSSYLSSQLRSAAANDVVLKKVLKECADKYGFAAYSLRASAKDLAAESFDYAYLHVTAAEDYPNACHSAFKRFPGLAYPPELAHREDGLKRICHVVLGIIDKLGW